VRIATEASGLLMIAIAIYAHAWIAKVTPQPVANVVGWVVVIVTAIVFGSHFLHCG
jgi:hypothetical protein